MKLLRLLFVMMPLLMAACASPQAVPVQQPLVDEGSLTVYLQPFPQEVHRLSLDIGEINAVREDGTLEHLIGIHEPMKADRLIGVQKRLLSTRLAPGQYSGLTITFKGATLFGEDGDVDLLVPAEPVFAEQDFTIEKGRATTLFLKLLPERIVMDGFRLAPRFALGKSQQLLISLKGFASNTLEHNLSIFDKKEFVVTDTLALGAQPRGVALDQFRELLYVAVSGENAIEVIEVNNVAVIGRINLKFGDNPTEIVLGSERRVLFTINPDSQSASIIDTSSLIELDKVWFKSEPADIFRSATGSSVFVLLPDTNSISYVDYSSFRRAEPVTVRLDETPLRGIAGADGNSLFLLTRFSPNLLVLNQGSLSISNRIYIGSGGQDLIEEQNGLVYVLKKRGEIAIVDPSVGAVIDSFSVPRGGRYLALDTDQNVLIVSYPELGVLEKFDLVGKKSLGRLDVGIGASEIAVMGER